MPQLAKSNLCTGCTACASVCPRDCITMMPDAGRFLHPVVDEESCIGCGLCEQACPVQSPGKLTHSPAALAVKSRDDASRMASTSGGIFVELARDILAKGGAVFGAAYNEHFRVVHICVEKEADLDRLRGAKYSQSDLSDSFRDVKRRLENGQQVLFSGTPCQVLGLRSFLRRDYENLLLVDLVCHSVPSPLVWEKYLEYISGGKTLTAVNLRCKDTGWSRYGYSNRFDFSDGSSRLDRSADSIYMKLFGGGWITSPACSDCPAKGYARVSDLTLGDFWGIWDIAPEMDDNRGTSVVLVQTEKGRAAIAGMEQKAVTLEEASRENPAILHAAAANPQREQIMMLAAEGAFDLAGRKIMAAAENVRRRRHAVWLLRRAAGFVKRKLCRR